MKRLLLFLVVLVPFRIAQSQEPSVGIPVGGGINLPATARSRPDPRGTSLPANCSVGERYFKTDEPAGQNVYGCTATNTWTLLGDGGGAGGGITSLGGQIGSTQTLSAVDDTNVTLAITSATNNHQFALGWTGTLDKTRQQAATVYNDQANTFGAFLQDLSTSTLKPPNSATPPGTCTVGEIYIDTDAALGLRINWCSALNTWTAIDNPFGAAIDDGELASNYSGTGACGANTWASTLNDNASPTCTQPDFSNLSGTVGDAQIAAGAVDGGAGGEIADGTVDSNDLATANKTISKSIVIFDPTTDDTNKVHIYWPAAVTLARIAYSVDTGTVSINFDERAEGTPNTAGTNTLSSALVCDTDSQVTTSFSDSGIAIDVPHNLQITATSGTPTIVRIHVKATIN